MQAFIHSFSHSTPAILSWHTDSELLPKTMEVSHKGPFVVLHWQGCSFLGHSVEGVTQSVDVICLLVESTRFRTKCCDSREEEGKGIKDRREQWRKQQPNLIMVFDQFYQWVP